MNEEKEINNLNDEERNPAQVPEALSVQKVPTANIAPIPPLPEGTPAPVQTDANADSAQIQESDMQQAVAPLPAPIVKQEQNKEIKAPKIIWGDFLSSWILALATVLVFILIMLLALAKSGLLALPIFSKVYSAPEPTRIVIAEPQTWDEFRDILSARLQEKSLDGQVPIVLDVSEREFTALLQGVVSQGLRNPEYTAEIAQVVFLPGKIEMYFYITWKDFLQAQILAEMTPVLHNDGTVELKITEAVIGDLPLPGDWSMQMIGYFFERDMGTWKIVLSNGYGIQDTILSEGSIKLFIGPLSP
jgi:hypothetical protein